MQGCFFFIWRRECTEIEKVIAQAKVHVLRCITVVFKCVAHPSFEGGKGYFRDS